MASVAGVAASSYSERVVRAFPGTQRVGSDTATTFLRDTALPGWPGWVLPRSRLAVVLQFSTVNSATTVSHDCGISGVTHG